MNTDTLLSIPLHFSTTKEIIEKIKKNLSGEKKFLHIVTINPEILVIAQDNPQFKKILSESDIQICDGVGVQLACKFLRISSPERVTGVDLMEQILQNFNDTSLSVLLIGGRSGLAKDLADCYGRVYPQNKFVGLDGYKDVNKPTQEEEKHVLEAIHHTKPDLLFVAFGAPAQELWIDSHRAQIGTCVCMGVGGSFDYLSGEISRAPVVMRTLGFEWLYRLFRQPWRFFRQLRLVEFVYLVILQKLGFKH